MSPRLGALLSALGGSCIGIPLFFQQTNSSAEIKQTEIINKTPPIQAEVTKDLKTITPDPVQEVQTGNCKLIKIETNSYLEDILWGDSYKLNKDFDAFDCINTNENIDTKIPDSWTGLFPKEVIVDEGRKLVTGNKYDIKINTQSINTGGYITTFSGNIFEKSNVTGYWSEPVQQEGDKNVIFVTVPTINKSIYLAFTDKLKK